MKQLDILVVEDGASQRKMMAEFLIKEGYAVAEAANGLEALERVKVQHFDLVLLDYKMPGMNGMEVLKALKGMNPEIAVVITTAFGAVETAVLAMKAGALDYLTKPIDFEELLLLIKRVAERQTLIRENEILRRDLATVAVASGSIIFRSYKMTELINLVSRVAPSKATVLVTGESGTGKELFARLLHNLSPRRTRSLVCVNCSALPETLLESELFGHEKGAFTGATTRRIGRFEQSDGSTLFLDEIGELTPPTQVKLLRFLQEKEFQRIGSNQNLRTDVRIVAATNRDLMACVKSGSFREDLFFRLNVVSIHVPPLRERKEDIPPLLDYFIDRYSKENKKKITGITAEAKSLLMQYDFPGNVRELENIIERAVVIARDEVISIADIPFGRIPHEEEEDAYKANSSLRLALEDMEKRMIAEAMQKSGAHQTRAAEMLGISERVLRYKLKKYGLKESDAPHLP